MTTQQLTFLYLDIGMAFFLLIPRWVLAEVDRDVTATLSPIARIYGIVIGTALLICIWPCLLVSAVAALFRR